MQANTNKFQFIDMIDWDNFDPMLISAQAHRRIFKDNSETIQFFGDKMTLEEMERRNALAHKPLTQEDVPKETWTAFLAQHSVREDDTIITNTPSVAWGRLDGTGGIEWFAALPK